MSHDGKRPVTLEDLLRLKRAERPAPEFWDQFDRELRAKQLAALVQKRPWWHDWPRVFAGTRRFQLPLGAAAVLAVTFISVRDFSSAPELSAPTDVGSVPATARAMVSEPSSLPPSVEVVPVATSEMTASEPASDGAHLVSIPIVSDVPIPASVPSRVMPLLVGAVEAAPDDAGISPSARSIAANLAAVEAAEAVAVRGLLGHARSFDTRALATRAVAVEPLQQMTHPSEVRLARYRSPLVVTVAEDSVDRTGERVARRISADRLYEHIGRIGARGDSVSLKF